MTKISLGLSSRTAARLKARKKQPERSWEDWLALSRKYAGTAERQLPEGISFRDSIGFYSALHVVEQLEAGRGELTVEERAEQARVTLAQAAWTLKHNGSQLTCSLNGELDHGSCQHVVNKIGQGGFNVLHFEICSGGGFVDEANSILDAIDAARQRRPSLSVTCHAHGRCESAAVLLLLAGDRDHRTATPDCSLMLHNSLTPGAAEETVETISGERHTDITAAAFMSSRTGVQSDRLLYLMDATTRFVAGDRIAQELHVRPYDPIRAAQKLAARLDRLEQESLMAARERRAREKQQRADAAEARRSRYGWKPMLDGKLTFIAPTAEPPSQSYEVGIAPVWERTAETRSLVADALDDARASWATR